MSIIVYYYKHTDTLVRNKIFKRKEETQSNVRDTLKDNSNWVCSYNVMHCMHIPQKIPRKFYFQIIKSEKKNKNSLGPHFQIYSWWVLCEEETSTEANNGTP
jgi:hypothetical protein